MNQEQMTIYQSNLVVFDEVKNVLHSACHEGWSGVFLIVADNGDSAGFSLDHGKIVDAGYKAIRGNEALPSIKNIERARFFFEQEQLALPCEANSEQDLPDTAQILNFLDINVVAETVAAGKPPCMGKVMVVDDSRMVRAVVKKILAKANYEVVEAVDGEHAISAIEEERPDLVLLDIVMPCIDGNEVLRRVRATEFGKELPVVMMTSTDSLVEDGGVESGRLAKPFKPDDLLQKLDDYFLKNESNAA
ncbi:MAG: response regulator [Gammaproteobacteria bacterium]|nr:response regulator [Gammaproteobacteria bacterium]